MIFARKIDVDYSIYKFKAVIDFIEIEIYTAAPTRGDVVHDKCKLFGVSFADPQDRSDGSAASTFRIRLYDLKNFAALQSKIASIEGKFPFSRLPTITMIEVAFDAYSKEGTNKPATRDDLTALAARMAYRVANPVSTNSRTYDGYKGSPQALPRSIEALTREFSNGRNVAIGNTDDDKYQHGYFKCTDNNKQPLPQDQHRARFEIRLAGAGLPCQSRASWEEFRFERLAAYLSFRTESDSGTAFQQMLVSGYADKASHRKAIKRHDGGGTCTRVMPADQELNRIVRKCLQHLTARWIKKRGKRPGKMCL